MRKIRVLRFLHASSDENAVLARASPEHRENEENSRSVFSAVMPRDTFLIPFFGKKES